MLASTAPVLASTAAVRVLLTLFGALGLCMACGEDGPLRWHIRMDPPERPQTRFEVRVLAGGCDALTATQSFVVRRGEDPQTLSLEPGSASIEVTAVDGECRPYARGCTAFEVPVPQDVTVRLALLREDARCPVAACSEGLCLGSDAGGGDAGADAAPEDGGVDACTPVATFEDVDGDGFGSGAASERCPGPGRALRDGDCDDGDPTVHPDADETCNRIDDDCDDATDEGGVPGEGCAPCRPTSIAGRGYLLCPDPTSWPLAQDACAASGRALATIEAVEEDDALRAAMQREFSIPQFWIGLSDRRGADVFEWPDGSEVGAYAPFVLGDPDNDPPRCVRSVNDTDPVGWRDRPCVDPFPFVCDEPAL